MGERAVGEPLWTAAELKSIGARFDREPDAGFAVTGVSIDSRTLKPGDLFVAIRSGRDGHEFLPRAMEMGAAAAIVDHVPCRRPIQGAAPGVG